MWTHQPINHYTNNKWASWWVTDHITSSKICWWFIAVHLLFNSHTHSKAVSFLSASNKPHDILQKWVSQRRNWLTNMKVYQKHEELSSWKHTLNWMQLELLKKYLMLECYHYCFFKDSRFVIRGMWWWWHKWGSDTGKNVTLKELSDTSYHWMYKG